jgi:hypothetical protein
MQLKAEHVHQLPHGPGCMLLPRDEMAFRKRYEPLLVGRKITAVFRPGNRVFPNRRGYIAGETVTARVIERCGSDTIGLPPQFNDIRIPIRIKRAASRTEILRGVRRMSSTRLASSSTSPGSTGSPSIALAAR